MALTCGSQNFVSMTLDLQQLIWEDRIFCPDIHWFCVSFFINFCKMELLQSMRRSKLFVGMSWWSDYF